MDRRDQLHGGRVEIRKHLCCTTLSDSIALHGVAEAFQQQAQIGTCYEIRALLAIVRAIFRNAVPLQAISRVENLLAKPAVVVYLEPKWQRHTTRLREIAEFLEYSPPQILRAKSVLPPHPVRPTSGRPEPRSSGSKIPVEGELRFKTVAYRAIPSTPISAEVKQIQERLGHPSPGSLTLDVYTHSEWRENLEAAKLAGEQIEKAVNSVSLTTVNEKRLADENQQAFEAA